MALQDGITACPRNQPQAPVLLAILPPPHTCALPDAASGQKPCLSLHLITLRPLHRFHTTHLCIAWCHVRAEALLVLQATAEEPHAEAHVVRVLHLLTKQLLFTRPAQLDAVVALGLRRVRSNRKDKQGKERVSTLSTCYIS